MAVLAVLVVVVVVVITVGVGGRLVLNDYRPRGGPPLGGAGAPAPP